MLMLIHYLQLYLSKNPLFLKLPILRINSGVMILVARLALDLAINT